MKSIHTFDVFAPTDEQEEAMNKKRGGHYRRGKNKEMDYFIAVSYTHLDVYKRQGKSLCSAS